VTHRTHRAEGIPWHGGEVENNKTALVTGTSSGIGLHAAIGLAKRDMRVVATMRDTSKADALRAAADDAGVSLEIRALDVTEEAAAADLIADLGRVDILVNNAGRGSVGSLEQLTTEDLRSQLEVNYIGVATLTRLVLPGMRAVGSGRIVTVTSVGGAVGQPFADAYCAAKFAVEGLMQSLAPVAARFGIDISIVEPAAVGSSFTTNVDGVGTDPARVDADDPYGPLLAAYLRRTTAVFANAQTAADAAQTVVEAAVTETAKFRWQTSDSAAAFAGLSLADLDGSRVAAITSTWLD
jgi:NAD(P)-dependent dehydrogenase (short-subunit alcohol dehydrogenase family)